MSSRPRWRVITVDTVEERGGRAVYLLEHEGTKERVRVYERLGRLRYFDAPRGDRPVQDRTIAAAVRRRKMIRRGEGEAVRSLFPTTSRDVIGVPRRASENGAAVRTHPAP